MVPCKENKVAHRVLRFSKFHDLLSIFRRIGLAQLSSPPPPPSPLAIEHRWRFGIAYHFRFHAIQLSCKDANIWLANGGVANLFSVQVDVYQYFA